MTAGRKPLPSKVHYLHGNASKKTAAELRAGFEPDVELPRAPKFLQLKGCGLEEAKREYKRLGEELLRYRLISELDRNALAMAAVEWGMYCWAVDRMATLASTSADPDAGLVEMTETGYKMQSVYLQIARRAQDEYRKFAALFGLSPSDRMRLKADTGQLSLPGLDSPGDKPTLASFA